MLQGRNAQIQMLEDMAASGRSTLTILYGRTGIGKTALVREFCRNHDAFCYSAPQASLREQLAIMKAHAACIADDGYSAVFDALGRFNVWVIEEFQNIVKTDKTFMDALTAAIRARNTDNPVTVICTSSSISWIENSLVAAIGANALAITTFLKLKELSFVDTVRMFPKYSVADCIKMYAITGGVPSYMSLFSDSISIKDNICRLILSDNAPLRNEGSRYIKEELRETSLYNTILYCIANGETKLNELHAHTGFGRDKISVYLKNMMEREIVEKIFSFDTKGNEHTRKGLYGIRAGLVGFWFRFIYAHESELIKMTPQDFYDTYIDNQMDDFAAGTFARVGTEYIELMDSMNQLPVKIDRRGCWWGKNGNIDLIACDTHGKYVVSKCNARSGIFTYEMYEELMKNIELAGIGSDYIYLFSIGTFDEKLTALAAGTPNVVLIGIEQL